MPQTREIRTDFLLITGGVPPWGLGMTIQNWNDNSNGFAACGISTITC